MRLGLALVAEARVYRVIVAGDANRVDPRGHQGLLVCPIVAQSSPIVSADKLIFRGKRSINGSKKLERYGEALLEVVRSHSI